MSERRAAVEGGAPAPLTYRPVDPEGAEASWCLDQYFAELDRRFEGGVDFAASGHPEAVDMVPPRGVFLIGYSEEQEPSGCGVVQTLEPGTGEIKRMWIAPQARGRGEGKRLLEALEEWSRSLGHHRVRLDTNRVLTQAIAMYRGAGYHEIPAYSFHPYAHLWFEKVLGL